MANQYIWLYNNLEKYQFNSEEAKALLREYQELNVDLDTELDDNIQKKLEDCYNRFVKMFNNNLFSHANGLETFDIETNELDCYFLEIGEEFVPTGFYKQAHLVESVVSLNQKLEEQKSEAKEAKGKLLIKIIKEEQSIAEKFINLLSVKQASYWRAILATLSSIAIVRYTVLFFQITNISRLLQVAGNENEFAEAARIGMLQMPIFAQSGVAGWWWLLILHLALLVVIICSLKGIVQEYILAKKKQTAKNVYDIVEKKLNKLNDQIDENIETDFKKILPAVRQGTSVQIEKNKSSRIIKKLEKVLCNAKEYVTKEFTDLRGIKSDFVLGILIISMISGFFGYSLLGGTDLKSRVITWNYERQVAKDKKELRAQKIVQLIEEDCAVYKSSSSSSKVVASLPKWVTVEVLEKEWSYGEEWSKIKKITNTEIITGWIPTSATIPFNAVDYNVFSEARIETAEASSYLVGKNTTYVPAYAYDWNRQTSWQDGNEYSSGDGEQITLYLAEPTELYMIQIFPGNASSEEMYQANERIKKAEISFSDGKTVTYEFDDTFVEEYQTLWLNQPVVTDYISIEILDTYSGDKYDDLSVSEIHAYGIKK